MHMVCMPSYHHRPQLDVQFELSMEQVAWLQEQASAHSLGSVDKAVRVLLSFVYAVCEAGLEKDVFGMYA